MSEYIVRAGLDIGLLIVGALALIALLKGVATLIRALPLRPAARRASQRIGPVLGLATVLAYVAFGALLISMREPLFAWVLASLFLLLIIFAWSSLYDLMAGVAFRAGQLCQVGDHVEVGDVQGRVVRLGSRVLVLRTRSGDEAVLPYGRIHRNTLRRTQSVPGAHVHAFIVDGAPLEDMPALRHRIVEAALRCPWSAVLHEPKLEVREDGRVEVSIFALHAEYAPLVEAAVRKSLEAQSEETGATPTWLSPPPWRTGSRVGSPPMPGQP